MKITIESDNPKLLAHLKELNEKCAVPAQVSALNSSAQKTRKQALSTLRTSTGIPSALLKNRIAVPKGKKATAKRVETTLFGGLYPIKVSKLTPAPRKLKGGHVKYKTLPGGSISPKAFIANNTRGHLSVFERKTAARLPLRNITVDISGQLKSAISNYLAGGEARTYYEKTFFTQMDRRIRGSLYRQGLTVK